MFTDFYDVGKVLLEIISGATITIAYILGVRDWNESQP